MNLLEHHAKALVLAPAGIPLLDGAFCSTVDEVVTAARSHGPCVIKAQVPAGKRGKAGGIRLAQTPEEARAAAEAIIGMTIDGHRTEAVLVEQLAPIAREFYISVLHAPHERGSLVLFAAEGGMDIEEIAAERPDAIRRHLVDTPDSFGKADAMAMLNGLGLGAQQEKIADILVALYRRYRETDAELIEINPLAELKDGRVIALDCKFSLDDAAVFRQQDIAAVAASDQMTRLESEAAALGLKFIELEGGVGILANGAGLTMTTMDVVSYQGGKPANFLEIGGDAYTKAEPALKLLLSNPGVRSLVVNFCGAFARTDVMTRGVIDAWRSLSPEIPVFFSVHGTGEDEAVALIREEFNVEPFDLMEDAVQAAIGAAR
ncbi:acetate--CoA ligase family protein [Acidiphilium sp. AL]|uniref:succinate--CoA ligase subunit beta n=1 Tax=Acidiphilium sp. AL TaxID=2871704 RepID=UPI0021CAF507|nr:ATP-grasp domain-containing protein [Acidiphilium sp. AL]MCU4160396.1 acetate--CoA ligase family protein [Acidiphilium sp. AL]